MDTKTPSFERWNEALQRAILEPSSIGSLECPHCGQHQLRLVYLLNSEDDQYVSAVFWCDSCLHGLMPRRSMIPDEGDILLRGEAAIPRFKIVHNRPE